MAMAGDRHRLRIFVEQALQALVAPLPTAVNRGAGVLVRDDENRLAVLFRFLLC